MSPEARRPDIRAAREALTVMEARPVIGVEDGV